MEKQTTQNLFLLCISLLIGQAIRDTTHLKRIFLFGPLPIKQETMMTGIKMLNYCQFPDPVFVELHRQSVVSSEQLKKLGTPI